MNFDAIIFDLDGTLLDTASDVLTCANLTLRDLGLREISIEDAKRSIGPGPDNFVRIVLPPGQRHRFDEFIRIFRRYYDEHCLDATRPFPGIKELLQLTNTVPKAVASNKPKVYTLKILEAFDLAAYFSEILGPEDVSKLKPEPDMLLLAARRLVTPVARILMVGDTDNDVFAARKAGMAACAVTWGYSLPQELSALNPDYLVHSPPQLLQVFALTVEEERLRAQRGFF